MKIVLVPSLVAAHAAAVTAYASLPPTSSSFETKRFEMQLATARKESACRPLVLGGNGNPHIPMKFKEVIVMKQGRHIPQAGPLPTAEC
ncbi:MAG: hypothetical protein ACK4N1_01920 [Pseudorhizobium sp.]